MRDPVIELVHRAHSGDAAADHDEVDMLERAHVGERIARRPRSGRPNSPARSGRSHSRGRAGGRRRWSPRRSPRPGSSRPCSTSWANSSALRPCSIDGGVGAEDDRHARRPRGPRAPRRDGRAPRAPWRRRSGVKRLRARPSRTPVKAIRVGTSAVPERRIAGDRGGVGEGAVLDRIDPGPRRRLDAARAMGVGGDLEAERMGGGDDRAHLLVGEMRLEARAPAGRGRRRWR